MVSVHWRTIHLLRHISDIMVIVGTLNLEVIQEHFITIQRILYRHQKHLEEIGTSFWHCSTK